MSNIKISSLTPGTPTNSDIGVMVQSSTTKKFTLGDLPISTATQTALDAKGDGTVTSVSVTPANGITGNVSSSITTPAITLTLGAITPSSIVASGTIAGSNLAGTNTGDQIISDATITTTDITTNNVSTSKHGFTPKLPNDATKYLDGTGAYTVPSVSGSGTVTSIATAGLISGGTITTTGTITTSIATGKLVGRSTAGTGVMEEITLGTNLSFTGTTLNASAGAATMAIGATVTSGTTGSVLFVGAGPVLAQDNSYFQWDSTNHIFRVGSGVSATTVAGQTGGILAYMDGGNAYYVPLCGQNTNPGVLCSTDLVLGNDLATDTTNYSDFGISSSGNTDSNYTLFATGTAYWYNQSSDIAITTATAGKSVKIGIGGTLVANEVARFTSTGITVGLAGTTLGVVKFSGNTSGTLSVQSPAAASGVNTLQAVTDTFVYKATTDTLTNKRVTKRIGTEASSATSTPTADSVDQWNVTALAVADAFAAPTGTPTDGQDLVIRIKDNGTARALTWNSIYRASTDLALPTTTVISKTLYLGFRYNVADLKWDLLGLLNNF